MGFFTQLYQKFLLKLHNYLYYKISVTAIKLNNGVHPKHRLMKYHQYFIDNIEKDSKVLDIGCGIGVVANSVAKKAKLILACDIDKRSLEIAKHSVKNENIKFIYADATDYDFNDYFDYIILSNVLEHIKDRITFLKKVKHFGDCLLIRVPMVNRSWLTLYKKQLGIEYRLDPTHYIEYTYYSFQKEIESAGLKIISSSIQFGEIWAIIKST